MVSPRIHSFAVQHAFKDSWEFIKGWWFKGIGGILALVTFFHDKLGLEWWEAAAADFAILLFILLVHWCVSYRKHWREERIRLNVDNVYGDAIGILNQAFAKIHHTRRLGKASTDEITEALTALCEHLQKIFDKKAGKGCSICIKVVPDDAGPVKVDTAVRTLCRDGAASAKVERKSVDDSLTVHDIFSNTSFCNFFSFMSSPKGSFYMNNDLPGDRDYKSTSFQVRGNPEKWNPVTKRYDKWPLAYQSEIVVPIGPYGHNHQKERPLVYGYLCVDSPSINVFNDTYDVEILKGVADGIVDVIKSFIGRDDNPTADNPVNPDSHGGQH